MAVRSIRMPPDLTGNFPCQVDSITAKQQGHRKKWDQNVLKNIDGSLRTYLDLLTDIGFHQ